MASMPLSSGGDVAGFFVIVVVLILVPAGWVYSDASRRGKGNAAFLGAVTFLAGLVGVVVGSYLLALVYYSARD